MEQLIYDRTSQDVEYALNHQDSESFLKGSYNYTDLNRVESWCRYLADELTDAGYEIDITTKIDWTMADFPREAQLERIRKNIKAIIDGYRTITQIYADVNNFNYQKANNWEKILSEVYTYMHNMKDYYVHSGVSSAGQGRMWQNRFRRRNWEV